jgi:uncharacterized phage protein (TIGR01671 family)
MSEIKFKLVFQHPTSKEIIISSPILLDDLINKYSDIYELVEKFCTCNCQPIGETNVVECNCCDYFDEFECIDKLQYTGLKDCKGVEIYKGDVCLSCQHSNPNSFVIEFIEGGFCGTYQGGYPLDINHFYPSTGCCIEVIGNIHTNPELMEVAK